jgi:hypothetical protein
LFDRDINPDNHKMQPILAGHLIRPVQQLQQWWFITALPLQKTLSHRVLLAPKRRLGLYLP